MNIIRIKYMNRVERITPFTVEELRDIILIRADFKNHDKNEQKIILDETLEELFPNVEPKFRGYFFIEKYIGSIGGSKLQIVVGCPSCKHETNMMLDLKQDDLNGITLDKEDVSIMFSYPDQLYYDENNIPLYDKIFLENISKVKYKGEMYDWDSLDDESKDGVINMIEFSDFETIINKMKIVRIYRKFKCKCKRIIEVEMNDILDIFKVSIDERSINLFYDINSILVKSGFSIRDIMGMIPIERTIYLNQIEKEIKEKAKK